VLALWPVAANAHDASGWGGLFRSTDGGATWFQANQGRLVAGALAVAVDSADANHLLMGTDAGLLATRNGGLDWQDAATGPSGPVFAVAIASERHQLAVNDRGLYHSNGDDTWHPLPLPAGVSPVRALVSDPRTNGLYLLGWKGLFYSEDWGTTWAPLDSGLPEAAVTSLVIVRTPAGGDLLVCIANGQVWATDASARNWQRFNAGLPGGQMQVLAADPSGDVLWAAGDDRVYRSESREQAWQAVGQPLPDSPTEIRGLAMSPDHRRLILSTHRGVYTTLNNGATWSAPTDNLPGHLEAGPLIHDPADPRILYVGFALTPYDEQWRRVVKGHPALSQLTVPDAIGAAAFLVLLLLGAVLALRWLARNQPPHVAEPVA